MSACESEENELDGATVDLQPLHRLAGMLRRHCAGAMTTVFAIPTKKIIMYTTRNGSMPIMLSLVPLRRTRNTDSDFKTLRNVQRR